MGNAHVVDGSEVLLAAVEVGRYRQPVVEVVPIDQIAGAADVEHDRDARLLRARPHRVEADVARRMPCRATRRDEQRRGAEGDRLVGHGRGAIEVGEWDVARRLQAGVDRAELDHAAVVRTGRAVGQVEIAGVLPVVQSPVVERVEQQLALETEQVQHAWPILGDERPRRREVLAVHDLGGFAAAVLVARVAFTEPIERREQIALLFGRITGLAQLVSARVCEAGQAIAKRRVGVVAQPCGRFHDVGVGIVDDALRIGVVGHGGIVAPEPDPDLLGVPIIE